jgi:tape measure domain-containing protein
MTTSDIVARLTLNAREFTGQFDRAINQATDKARTGGKVIGDSLGGAANGGLQELANRIPVVGSALGGLGGVALGAAAGVGALTAVFVKGIAEAEAFTQEIGKLDAVLKATGNNTGFTADQLQELAGELENTFAVSAEEFLAAERQLATFKGIAGSTFRDVLELSADLSASFGGDLSSNSEKLAITLQGLAEGNVQPLGRAFKFLGAETLETIKALAEQGRAFEAQQALIDALRSRVGGTGAAAGDNLTGDFFRLKDAIGDAARELALSSGAYDTVRSAIQETTTDLGLFIEKLNGLSNPERAAELAKAVAIRLNPFTSLANSAGLITQGDAAPALKPTGLRQQLVGSVTRAAEEAAARAATEAAAAEARKRAAAEATATALKEQGKAQAAATKAANDQAKALNRSLADLQFQAQLAGKSREEVQRLTTLRNLELQYGKLITAEIKLQAEAYLAMAETARALGEEQKRILIDFEKYVDASRDRSAAGMDDEIRKFVKDRNPFVPDPNNPQTRQDVQRFSDVFYDIFSRGQGNFWNTFREAGFRSLSDILAKLAKDSGLARLLEQNFPGAGKAVGGAVSGAGTGMAVGSLMGRSKETRTGAAVGGAIGSFVPIPGAPIIGAVIGGLIGGAFARDSFSGATLTSQNGGVTASGLVARGDGQQDIAQQLVAGVDQGLQQLAAALGGRVASGLQLGTVGTNREAFVFNASGTSTAAGAGGARFDTAEKAIEAALRNALSRGAITGVDASITRLLSTGDLQTQLAKAAALSNALRSFDAAANPFADQVRTLNDEFRQLRDIMAEAGSNTADLNKASAEYDKRLQQIRDAAGQATATLRGFLDNLGFGSSSPLALGDQRSAAFAAYQAQVGRIGTDTFDQGAFTQSGQALLDIETQLFGRTDAFFATFSQVQADTNRAIAAIDRAASITGDNPFARATAAATEATAENTATMAATLANLPGLIGQQIAAALAAGNGFNSFGAERGFVLKDAA